jgi:hypothetical protein
MDEVAIENPFTEVQQVEVAILPERRHVAQQREREREKERARDKGVGIQQSRNCGWNMLSHSSRLCADCVADQHVVLGRL